MVADAVAVIDRPWPRTTEIPAAFEELFRAEYARVVRVAYRVVGDQGAAEDVAQDVFIAFYRAHPADAPYAAPWLHQAAAHTALNAVRSRARRTAREERDAIGRFEIGLGNLTDAEADRVLTLLANLQKQREG